MLDALVAELVGDDDRSLVVEDLTVPGKGGDGESGGAEARQTVVAVAVNAAQSPPFMTARRVVVLRDVGNLLVGDVDPLVACLGDPLDTTDFVFVAGGGASACRADEGVEGSEGEGARGVPHQGRGRARGGGGRGGAHAAARRRACRGRPGRQRGWAGSPPSSRCSARPYGPGDRLGAEDVAPYLGETGGVPPYLLTNAIEEGDVSGALELLQRILTATGPQQPKPMHPLQVLAMLHNHIRRIARLDDPEVRNSDDAIAALGGKVKEFPARKALRAVASVSGTDGIREAYAAIAQADLDLKGARAIPEDAVMEVLVARLAALSARSGGAPSRRGPARSRGGRSRR